MRIISFFSVFALLFFSCVGGGDGIKRSLKLAGGNRGELETLLEHYPKGSREHKAARFLVGNMSTHAAPVNADIDAYRDMLRAIDTVINVRTSSILDSLWNIHNTGKSSEPVPHVQQVTAEYLIDDIDLAFGIWDRCAWRDSISFETFRDYILPYSVMNEPITAWRRILHDKYAPLIEGISSPKEAFDIVYVNIRGNFKLGTVAFPYSMDPLLTDKTRRGMCDDRTLYIVAVMRSLCIPTVYDFTPAWANYSTVGHSWALYAGVGGDEIYAIFDKDSVSHKDGILDEALWKRMVEFDDSDTDYSVDSLKKAPKIMRRVYSTDNGNASMLIRNAVDVSALHGLKGSVSIKADGPIPGDAAYLCVFRSGSGWTPVDVARTRGRSIEFTGINSDITYLIAYADGEGNLEPIGNPVTLYSDGSQVVRDPDPAETETVILRRKYVLFTSWVPNRSKLVKGYTFEGSNDPDFASSDTLHVITEMPMGIVSVDIPAGRPYRYLRVKPPYGTRDGMAETAFYGVNGAGEEVEMKGDLIYKDMEEPDALKLFDKDPLTVTFSRRLNFWTGYDLGRGNAMKVSRIMYTPWNDGNMIERGDEYELFYYDMGWRSLGKQIADSEYLTYDNVPKNALLWLRDLTKGKEERIFTYQNGKQIWW